MYACGAVLRLGLPFGNLGDMMIALLCFFGFYRSFEMRPRTNLFVGISRVFVTDVEVRRAALRFSMQKIERVHCEMFFSKRCLENIKR